LYDNIIVGGGHNGLTCAAYLAKAGKRVVVLEANPQVGGFCVTGDVPNAPGYRMNTYAIEFPFTSIGPSVVDDLDLTRHGLKWTYPDPHNTYLGPDGQTWSMWRDVGRTCESIARLSRRDAVYYERVMRPVMDITHAIIPYLMDHPTRPSPRTIASMIRRLAKSRRSLMPGARILLSSPLEVLDGFEREEVKALLALNISMGSFRPLDEPVNSTMLIYFALLHLAPLQRPVGGAGAFSEALATCVRAAGGEVRTSAPVDRILVQNGKARGVALQSGEELFAEQVVAAVDPVSLFTRLVDRDAVPAEVHDEVSRMRVLSNGISHFKGDLALARRPKFPKHDLTDDQLVGLTIAPTVGSLERVLEASLRGELAEEIPMYAAVPSVQDRTLVPPGSEGDSMFLFLGTVPYELADGRDWAVAKKDYLNQALGYLEEYSPGIQDSIIGAHAGSPRDFNESWAFRGSSRGVDLIPSQTGPWRPSPELSGYGTPIEGLWRTGHGTHPISGISGWSGRTTARTVLKNAPGTKRRGPRP
jgi:beta-carotene ketolase (CrtO type)